jgi:hypothetical protein
MIAAVVIMIDSIRRWLGTPNQPQISPLDSFAVNRQ